MSGIVPAVVERDAWGAAETREPYEELGELTLVVLHHSGRRYRGTVRHEAAHLRRIQQRHFTRGFSDVGYHFVVYPSGRVFLGRPADAVGAHVYGWNRETVSICLAGDFDVDRPTFAAIRALTHVRRELIPGGAGLPLIAHGDLADKRCPGRFLDRYSDDPEIHGAAPRSGSGSSVTACVVTG